MFQSLFILILITLILMVILVILPLLSGVASGRAPIVLRKFQLRVINFSLEKLILIPRVVDKIMIKQLRQMIPIGLSMILLKLILSWGQHLPARVVVINLRVIFPRRVTVKKFAVLVLLMLIFRYWVLRLSSVVLVTRR